MPGDRTDHPRLLITTEEIPGLRSLARVRRDIEAGPVRELWQCVLGQATAALARSPILPSDEDIPNRSINTARHRNLDYTVCHEAGQRVLRAALVHLLTGRTEFRVSAMAQLDALFDPVQWPDWMDQSHSGFGVPADLRTGMLSQAVGLAYDWLAPGLSDDERAWVIEGLDRRGIQPILRAIEASPWWMKDLNNWVTVILSGLGVAGMALDGEHPQAGRMIALAMERMEAYLSIYGPEGEFNESVNYAGANRLPVDFFNIHRHWNGGRDNRLSRPPFPEMCHWVMHTTLPPGRVVTVGDCHPERAVTNTYVAAVAAATRDGVLQWFYRQYRENTNEVYQLLAYDPAVPEISPERAGVPLFKHYQTQGKLVVSRSDWSPTTAACIVHAKAGREHFHEHNDVGQLCIDGGGERLIIDPGSPSGYPADFFEDERWQYYNASVRGHNVLMFDGQEPRYPLKKRGEPVDHESLSGRFKQAEFFPGVGAAWTMDLSPAYAAGQTVRRAVLHLHPGTVVVLDEARLDQPREISLRWHTVNRAEPDAAGAFVVHGRKALVGARLLNIGGGDMTLRRREQRYAPPYDCDRMGDPLEQRNESYVEAVLLGSECRLLTLFDVRADGTESAGWQAGDGQWTTGDVMLGWRGNLLELSSPQGVVSLPVDPM